MKKCRDCGKRKPESEYSISNKRTGCLRPECKKCTAKNYRERFYYGTTQSENHTLRPIKNIDAAIKTLELAKKQILELEKRLGERT